ncbi:MAG TPA: hypothetical protein VLT36_03175, partial [Candidatus Dormibacteraeota bacterium]|nr:hypothetical protein [Candidatus Dormibacteraeota bacterium]
MDWWIGGWWMIVGAWFSIKMPPLLGEWRLLKAQLAHARNRAADIAFRPVAENVTRAAQARVFVFGAFNGPG